MSPWVCNVCRRALQEVLQALQSFQARAGSPLQHLQQMYREDGPSLYATYAILCMYVCMYVCVYVCMHDSIVYMHDSAVCMYLCLCIHACMYEYIYIRIVYVVFFVCVYKYL